MNESIRAIDNRSLERIRDLFSEIPDEELIYQCINRSQVEYFFNLRYFFTQIAKSISNYFLGKPLFEEIDTTERAMLEIELEKWLCFYCLLQWGWDDLKTEARRKKHQIPDTPGDMLRIILANHAEYLFMQHQAMYLEFSPRKAYKQAGLISKIEGLLERLENGGNFKEEDMQLLNDFKKYEQNGEHPKPELRNLFLFCMSVFDKNKKNARIRHKYKDYLRLQGEEEASAMRSWHPRKKSQGWKVIKEEISALT